MRAILKGLGFFLAALAALLAAYAAYVFLSAPRVADNQSLSIREGATGSLARGREYTLLSWNLGFGAYSEDYSFFLDGGTHARACSREAVEQNTGTMLARIQEIGADFLLLQEVDVDSTRSYHVNQRSLLEAAFADYDAAFAVNYNSAYLFYPLSEPIGKSLAGMETFSTAPASASVRIRLPVEKGPMRLLDLDRCYTVTRIPLEGDARELCLYNLHLSAYTSDGSIATEQLKILLADMQSEWKKGNYALAGGDFNKDLLGDSGAIFGVPSGEFPWAQPFPADLLPEGISLFAPEEEFPSCRNSDSAYRPGTSFVLTVDGFLASENIRVISREVLDEGFRHSDHNPVLLKFALL